MIRYLIDIGILVCELIMLKPHILSGSYYEPNPAPICQCRGCVSDHELNLAAAFSTLTGKLAALPLVVLALYQLLDIGRETAVALRTAQVSSEGTLR